jgi:hypothetical protein
MKRIILLLLFIIVVSAVNAQWYSRSYGVSSLDSLNQDQLNLSWDRYSNSMEKGKIMTLAGGISLVAGTVLFISAIYLSFDFDAAGIFLGTVGYILVQGGFIATGIGIGKWVVGSSRKKDIEIALLKYRTTASAYGLGLSVSF